MKTSSEVLLSANALHDMELASIAETQQLSAICLFCYNHTAICFCMDNNKINPQTKLYQCRNIGLPGRAEQRANKQAAQFKMDTKGR